MNILYLAFVRKFRKFNGSSIILKFHLFRGNKIYELVCEGPGPFR